MKQFLMLYMFNFILIMLVSQSISGQTFTRHLIEADFDGIHVINIIDLDLDGDLDIIGGSEHTPVSTSVGLAWWRNEGGYPIEWTKFTIDANFLHIMSVDVADLNNDGFPDIVASSWENGRIKWWANSGDPSGRWSSYTVVSNWPNAHDALCYDFNNDGYNDIVGICAGLNRISVFYNQQGEIPSWNEDIVASSFSHALTLSIADLNNDDLPDLICSADGADEIAWWKNRGGSPPKWVKLTIARNLNKSSNNFPVDMNNDGQLDIIGSGWEGSEISYWICNNINTNILIAVSVF